MVHAVHRCRRKSKLSILLMCCILVNACSVPNHMHVSEGVSPKNVDTNVRFRTTYYFRTFDYCWDINPTISGGKTYQQIVPQTDTIYRYRMTGKASALGSKIKFESGTVEASAIDPFGVDVVYNKDVEGYVVRTQKDVRAEAEAAAARSSPSPASGDTAATKALARFNELSTLYETIAKATITDPKAEAARTVQLETVRAAMVEALNLYLGVVKTPSASQELAALEAISKRLDEMQKTLGGLTPQPPADAIAATKTIVEATATAVLAKLKAEVDRVLASKSEGSPASAICGPDTIIKKGFQIMGPEGLMSYDQNERLIMAMHVSAEPLIQTLQEYSGRILKGKANSAEQLLPLVRENMRVVEAQRVLDQLTNQAAGENRPAMESIANEAIAAFDAKRKTTTAGSTAQ